MLSCQLSVIRRAGSFPTSCWNRNILLLANRINRNVYFKKVSFFLYGRIKLRLCDRNVAFSVWEGMNLIESERMQKKRCCEFELITPVKDKKNGTPIGIWTPSLLVRSQTLYPIELWVHTYVRSLVVTTAFKIHHNLIFSSFFTIFQQFFWEICDNRQLFSLATGKNFSEEYIIEYIILYVFCKI